MYELRVLNGLYQGASLPLIGNEWTIGASEDDDLAIFEPGFAATAITLQRASNQFLLNNEEVALDTPWQFEHVWLIMCHAATPWENMNIPGEATPEPVEEPPPPPVNEPTVSYQPTVTPKKSRLPILVVGSVVLVLVFWLLSSMAQVESRPKPRPTNGPTPIESAVKTRKILLRMLKERELTDVEVALASQVIELKGSLITEDELQRLARMLKRFNKNYDSPLPIKNTVVMREYKLPFHIIQVTTGPIAHLVTEDGERLFVGDEIDGVRIVSITDKQIVFGGKFHLELAW